jgi:hypothetical protein
LKSRKSSLQIIGEAVLLRSSQEMSADQAVDFAFTLTGELARLLHGSGHREMAALLYGIGDMGELSRRRAAGSAAAGLTGPDSETLDFVLDQMAQLAELMSRHGVHDAAVLFRTPGQLRLAAESPHVTDDATSMAA